MKDPFSLTWNLKPFLRGSLQSFKETRLKSQETLAISFSPTQVQHFMMKKVEEIPIAPRTKQGNFQL